MSSGELDDAHVCTRRLPARVDLALHVAQVPLRGRRAARVGVSVVLLRVIENRDHGQQWLGVADIMRAEAHEEANARLATFAARSNGIAGITPECVIREGEVAQEILKLIEEDEDIAVLVLAAAVDKEGPGPLVSHLGSTAGTFPIPVAIVPGHLGDDEIDAMS